jgi:hypothetical protein
VKTVLVLLTVLCRSAWGQTYTISTFAGGGLPVNVPATSASVGPDVPQYIAADRAGNLFFVDHSAVLRLDAITGIATLVAGTGTPGFRGDNGPAANSQLGGPRGIAVDSAGNVYIADSYANRVRKVSNGVIPPSRETGHKASAATTARPPAPSWPNHSALLWTQAATSTSPTGVIVASARCRTE